MSSASSVVSDDDGEFLRKARNLIYHKARQGELFNVYTLLGDLQVSAKRSIELNGLLQSAFKAGLLVKAGMAKDRRPISPEEWIETGRPAERAEVQQYKGSAKLRGQVR